MTATDDGAALLAAILAQPDEDTPRLVYADWLQEQGQENRAEFIRVQCAGGLRTVRLTWMVPFESFFGCQPHQLGYVAAPGEAWAHHATSGKRVTFRRGFVDSLTCTAADWIQHADALLAAHPVTNVRLTTLPPTDGDEDDIWFVGDPAAVRIPHVDVLAEQTEDERAAHNSMAALCRLRWRRVKTFEFELSAPAFYGALPLNPELEAAMAAAGLQESPPVTQAEWGAMLTNLLNPPG